MIFDITYFGAHFKFILILILDFGTRTFSKKKNKFKKFNILLKELKNLPINVFYKYRNLFSPRTATKSVLKLVDRKVHLRCRFQ